MSPPSSPASPETLARTGTLHRLVASVLGAEKADWLSSVLEIDPRLEGSGDVASRAQVAMALNLVLYADLLDRVPSAARYVDDAQSHGRPVRFDHGALRTIDGPTGNLPNGYIAFARLLEPLGYEIAGTYPLPELHMTGRAFAHHDLPETVPQFFVSELHVALLPHDVQIAAARVFDSSRDPLGSAAWEVLDLLRAEGSCPVDIAAAALPSLAAAFDRQHEIPYEADYATLLAMTKEGAWIATEGNAFNHATDRVDDVEALAEDLAARGWPMKPRVEVSANGRVRQTALIADKVTREFRLEDGGVRSRDVPGSFYEFISRDEIPGAGTLDLTFDSGNATGIFSVTSAS